MSALLRSLLLVFACCVGAPFSCAHAAAANGATTADAMPATVVVANCSWDHPGVDPFMGELVAAVDRYRDIPADVRARLKARMERRDYDDLVSIRRDSIEGRGGYDYGKTITDMHFGTRQLCHSVTRTSWTPQMQERGLVYCESGQCILVPTVCRNVSRITRSGVG
ncbi:MAG: MHFG family PEP-CTERM protein, partial [Pseudomonadota bacterium]|nr:MHFG family PEP-CTERM protein [Pseudomonadota bacterium]